MDKFKETVRIQMKTYEAIVLGEFLARINEEDNPDRIEQKVLGDLESRLDCLIFRNGNPDIPIEAVLPQARQLVQDDMS